MKEEVVITGAGLVCSLGHSAAETWDALVSGRKGIRLIQGFDASGFECRTGAQVEGLDAASLGIHPRDARIMDKHSYMLIKCVKDAFSEAGLEKASLPGEDIGFFAGMGMTDYNIEDLLPAVLKSRHADGNLDYDKFFSSGYQEIHPLWPLSMLNNITFCQAAIRLGIRGENTVFSPHADSGAQAIAEGMRTLYENRARAVLAGGVSEKISPVSLARGQLKGILNTEGPECSPFSEHGNGTIPGEGCGMLAMELRSSADKRGIPYAVIISGFGSGCEINDNSFGPTVKAISNSMKQALSRAGLEPSDIDLIIANGDGTYISDRNEAVAINRLFPGEKEDLQVFSSKAALGHLLAGAPAVDIILGMHIIRHGIIPAMPDAGPRAKGLGFSLPHKEPFKKYPKRIMINCQSYEGQTASLIIEAV